MKFQAPNIDNMITIVSVNVARLKESYVCIIYVPNEDKNPSMV